MSQASQILKWFKYDHLPQGRGRDVSSIFHKMAHALDSQIQDGPEKTAGLRKLLEAKDCMVRASIGEGE